MLEAAKFWYDVLLRADELEMYELELFVAVAEWINKKPDPWDRPPTHFTLPPPPPELTVRDALGQDMWEELVGDPDFDEKPTIPAPAKTAMLVKKLT